MSNICRVEIQALDVFVFVFVMLSDEVKTFCFYALRYAWVRCDQVKKTFLLPQVLLLCLYGLSGVPMSCYHI